MKIRKVETSLPLKGNIINTINSDSTSNAPSISATKKGLEDVYKKSVAHTNSQQPTMYKTGDWFVREYPDGYTEMFYKKVNMSMAITNTYSGNNGGTKWVLFGSVNYPITLTELYNAQISVRIDGHLPSINFRYVTLTGFQYYVHNMLQGTYTGDVFVTITGNRLTAF